MAYGSVSQHFLRVWQPRKLSRPGFNSHQNSNLGEYSLCSQCIRKQDSFLFSKRLAMFSMCLVVVYTDMYTIVYVVYCVVYVVYTHMYVGKE